MCEIWTMGEILVEIMRDKTGSELYEKGNFIGPFPSGAPAIFIDTAARLGHKAGIIGGVGNDDFGRCVLDRLIKDGVDCTRVSVHDVGSTAVAFVTYFDDGSRKFIFHIGNTPAVRARAPAEIPGSLYFHVMGCSLMADEGFYRQIVETAEHFFKKGTKISFDPNIRPELLGGRDIDDIIGPVMKNCSVFMPGIDELLMISKENDIEKAVSKLFENETLDIIVLKKGKNGSTVFTRDGKTDFGVYRVVPVDPTGAGDCFDAGFLCGLIEGRPIPECVRIATAAASLNTAAFGPMEGDIGREDIDRMIMKGEYDD